MQLFEQFQYKKDRTQLIEIFMAKNEHQWIAKDGRLKRAFTDFLLYLKLEELQTVVYKPVLFIKINAKWACSVGKIKNEEMILAFPELCALLQSPSIYHGMAIFAHELGHIIYKHAHKNLSLLDAQVEADYFAYLCGYGEELQEILLDEPQSLDLKVRISRLTSHLITQTKKTF